ncbi:MAG: sugar phosphate isomerase/epimerase [Candidatus Buchananbacteria bacterium]
MFIHTGISDEAALGIEDQVKAHRELGWDYLELRTVDGVNVCKLSDPEFDRVCMVLSDANMRVSAFSSPIGDWSHAITDSFLPDCNLLRRTIPRMERLGVKIIRVMSYPNDKANPLPPEVWEKRAKDRMHGLLKIVGDRDIVLAHENCSGWGGLCSANNVALMEEINDPRFGVLFDTGNPPTYGKNSWTWYQAVKKWIVYVHIKDANGPDEYTYPGEGKGCVRRILKDLAGCYDGFISIEPHLKAVIHNGQQADDPKALSVSYINYGRRLVRLAA